MKRKIFVTCMLLLLLVQSADAMSSPNFRIDWTNLVSGSGGPASSSGYKVDITVGQTVDGTSSSPLFRAQMGYWGGLPATYTIFLPKVMKSP